MKLRWRTFGVLSPLALAALTLTGCVADPAPIMVGASAGNHSATVTWLPPLAVPAPLVAYVVTPYINHLAQSPTRFDSTATTQTVTGLTNGTTYTFAVSAINSIGTETAASNGSNIVTPTAVTAITAGYNDSCGLLGDGTAYCWGNNDASQLGDGTNTNSSTPVAVAGITNATDITESWHSHTCALLSDGTIKCWGLGSRGQLGNGTSENSPTPVTVTGISDATAIAGGDQFTCAVLAGGTVKCWGYNFYGQLGNGTTTSSSTPVTVTGITNATSVSTGFGHACALLADGTINCWGYNSDGQLGNGILFTGSSTPVAVTGITTATAISAGLYHTCAVLAGGTVNCWGQGEHGELGDGTTTSEVSTPVVVTGITTATTVSAGYPFSCASLSDGTIQCWGGNDYGQLGNGTTTGSTTPVPVTGITTATTIDAGAAVLHGGHTCALLSDGSTRCWGGNNLGQLGNGTTIDSTTPVTVIGL